MYSIGVGAMTFDELKAAVAEIADEIGITGYVRPLLYAKAR